MKMSLKGKIARFAIRSLTSMFSIKIMDLVVSELLAKDRLVSRHGFYYLTKLAEKLNVVALSVRGDYGTFVGASADTAILRRYAETGKWAVSTNNLIKQFFDGKAGTYLDIGANIGLTVVPIAANASVACHAFEPEPANYRNLMQNTSENCPNANVKLHQLALFDRKANLPFEIAKGNHGDHRIHVATGLVARQGEIRRKVIDVCAVHEPFDRPQTWLIFWLRRFFRLAPLYYAMLVVAVLCEQYQNGFDGSFHYISWEPVPSANDQLGLHIISHLTVTHSVIVRWVLP
jgi:FkbM family methyltransferase